MGPEGGLGEVYKNLIHFRDFRHAAGFCGFARGVLNSCLDTPAFFLRGFYSLRVVVPSWRGGDHKLRIGFTEFYPWIGLCGLLVFYQTLAVKFQILLPRPYTCVPCMYWHGRAALYTCTVARGFSSVGRGTG